jgi:hypothetical protein
MALGDFHQRLYGTPPSEIAQSLYEAYEQGYRGLDLRELDSERFQASLTLALYLTENRQHRVSLLVPKAQQDLVVQQLRNSALQLIKSRRKNPASAKIIQGLFHCLMLQSRILQLEYEPVPWVSIGFTSKDPLPEWMKNRLLLLL